MSDPFAIVPYHDSSDDIFSQDQILMLDDHEFLSLAIPELFPIAGPSSLNPTTPELFDHDNNNIMDADDPVFDPMIWDMLNDDPIDGITGNFELEPAPSGVHGDRNGDGYGDHNNPESFAFENSQKICVWPVPSSPYNCSCCQTLREIIHTDGRHYAKLEVHGRVGMINHAVLEKYDFDPSSNYHEYQMFDFCKESLTSVKQFLVQYCEDRKQDGYFMLQDPLYIFYEALNVGLNSHDNLNVDHFLQPSSINSGDNPVNNDISSQPEINNGVRVVSKRSLALQRERTGKLKLKDVSGYFHLPIDDAAKKMNICPTVMKKICRRGGLSRWPYRKIKSIEKKIMLKKESMISHNLEERAQAEAEIQQLEQELADIYSESSFE